MKHFWHPSVADFVAMGIWGEVRSFGECHALGFFDGPDLIAGVVFHEYSPDHQTIEISGAGQGRALTRSNIRTALKYPFDELNLRAVVARHSEKNTVVRKLWLSLGAKETLVPDLRGEGEAEVWSVLKKTKYRESRYGQTKNT